MSASQRQLEANRFNAQKSTGPRTEEGKAASSRNATTHGLYATDIVIDSPHYKESREDFEALLDSLHDDLKPEGALQEHLVTKIAAGMWRYRRTIISETARIRKCLSSTKASALIDERLFPRPDRQPRDLTDDFESCLVLDDKYSQQLVIFQMRLDREMHRALNTLRLLKREAAAAAKTARSTANHHSARPEAAPTPTYPAGSDVPPSDSSSPYDPCDAYGRDFDGNEPKSPQLHPLVEFITTGTM